MAAGGDEAFEQLWREHFASVARAAAGITGSVDEGADVAQEAFARAYQNWSRVRTLDRPDAWVRQVATRLAISHLRRARRRMVGTGTGTRAVVEEPVAPDDELVRALGLLTPAQRSVVVLRFYLDLSVEDVAHALRKRPGTVRALTHQAMERLRGALQKEPLDG